MQFQPQLQEKLYDLKHLFTLVNNDKNFVAGLVEIFITSIPPMLDDMKKACEEKNWEEVGKIAHKLKPTVETMRIQQIHEILKSIEMNVKELNNLNTISESVSTTNNLLSIVTIQLKREIDLNFCEF